MFRRGLTLTLALAAFASWDLPARADAEALPVCTDHECSNDYVSNPQRRYVDPVYGDELFRWDPISIWASRACSPDRDIPCVTPGTLRCYELALFPELEIVVRRCESTAWGEGEGAWVYSAPPIEVSPYATGPATFPRDGTDYDYVVRACEGSHCGDWGPVAPDSSVASIQIEGGLYACFSSIDEKRCEETCHPGAPKRFSAIPDCDEL